MSKKRVKKSDPKIARTRRGSSRSKQGAPAPAGPARGPTSRRVKTAPAEPEIDGSAGPMAPIVAIGASAGGLEAFSLLLQALPGALPMTIVLVQHLSPRTASMLPEILRGHCRLPVLEVADGMRPEPGTVYIIPPDATMTLDDGMFRLTPRGTSRTPIDTFFCSLARHAGEGAVAVILSGTASDGVIGIKAVKEAGGVTMAESPASAKFDGMPRSAIATGLIDFVLSPAEIGAELCRIAGQPFRIRARADQRRPDRRRGDPPITEEQMNRIFQALRTASGVDFTLYKQPTIMRRLKRRMLLNKIGDIDHYIACIEENGPEAQSLYHDILIHVTRFFREPESFESLKEQVFCQLLAKPRGDAPIRVWTPGCSTGEEPYSVAIALLEYLGEHAANVPIQIFATDLSEPAIERARSGVYSEAIANDVSPERLRRFFNRTNGNFLINKAVRDLCVFARQDLMRDPPFSKLDLIVCRNVLIYLGAALQKKLMATFHYALKTQGYLLLGQAETVGTHADLFSLVDKKHHLYQRVTVDAPTPSTFPRDYNWPRAESGRPVAAEARGASEFQIEANRLLLEKFAPAGVTVDSAFHVVQFHGQTGPFLEPAPGMASLSLLKLAREGLVHGLGVALREARKSGKPVHRQNLEVRSGDQVIELDLEAIPLGSGESRHYLVLFRENRRRSASKSKARRPAAGKPASQPERLERELARLQDELAANRDYLQSIIQDLETTNEELQSANEEILSSNEELQSTNEELDTAKEELQSTNEELNTLNEELHGRNEELSRVNSDLVNLLGGVQIAIVMISGDMRIRRFTPAAERILNLIPSDIGRPIGHIKPNFDCPDLEELIAEVVDTMTVIDREVCDRQGHWRLLRLRPYKSLENRIDGAVLALFDIHALKQQEARAAEAHSLFEAMLEIIQEPVLLLGESQIVYNVSRSWKRLFGWAADDRVGVPLKDFQRGAWGGSELLAAAGRVLKGNAAPGGDGEADQPGEIRYDCSLLPDHRLRLELKRIAAQSPAGARFVVIVAAPEEPAASSR